MSKLVLSERTVPNVKTVPVEGKDFLYRRVAKVFTAAELLEAAENYTVSVTFADTAVGFGHVALNGKAAEQIFGHTACKTGRRRTCTAVFDGSDAAFGPSVSVVDLPGIESVIVAVGRDEVLIAKARDERPRPKEVQPAFELTERPMQLITTVGDLSPRGVREDLPKTLENMADCVPYAKALGFNGVESYVRWDFVEYEQGVFDWSYYDAVIEFAARFDMKWFPLIIGGSAYALPRWFREETPGFQGFRCLEHGEENNVPTIFNDHQTPYVKRYLHELGKHYNDNPNVFGVRLGPSGNYGESQYPASGNWGYLGRPEHMHIGWWADDPCAHERFAAWLKKKYGTVEALGKAWDESPESFDSVRTFLPSSTKSYRKRKDFVDWYMFEMTDWCNRWAVWTREELKKPDIYQSAGGWGFCEAGTDFTDQTRGMVAVNGGIRATNEDESYELNFAITRMLSSAARFYGVPFGSEPAGYGTARSVINRLYNIIINNGAHLFYYYGNFANCDESAPRWIQHAPLLAERAEPQVDVAVLYPDTASKLFDSSVRYLDGSVFFSQVFPMRRRLDYDFCSEQMVLDGALTAQNYRALVILGKCHDGDYIEQAVLEKIDEWVRAGGTVICPMLHSNAPRGLLSVEGDNRIFARWAAGDTGAGRVEIVNTMREPLDDYIDDAAALLAQIPTMSSLTVDMLTAEKPRGVYLAALKNGKLVIYNDRQDGASVRLRDGREVTLEPVSIAVVPGCDR